MADPLIIPGAQEAFVDDARKPTAPWYRVLGKIIGVINAVDARPIPSSAADITYDHTTSGLVAVTAQAAIDEVEGRVDTLEAIPHPTVGMVKLTSGTISSAQATLDIVLSSYTAYRALKLVLSSFVPVTDAADLWLRFSTDGGSTFITTNYRYAAFGVRDGNSSANLVSTSAGQLLIGSYDATRGPSNVAAEGGVDSEIMIHNQTASRYTRARWHSGWMGANQETVVQIGQGTQTTQQDTDALRIMFASGNIASGDWALYGLS